jgi:large subunit ribosomal protein L31e
MAKLERIYTVPFGDAYAASRNVRVPKAVKILRTFAIRHMKAKGLRVVISEALNMHLWEHSIQRPPRRVKVRLVKEEDSVMAYLADEKIEPKKEAKKEEKKAEEKKSEAVKEAPKPVPTSKPGIQNQANPKPAQTQKPEAKPAAGPSQETRKK